MIALNNPTKKLHITPIRAASHLGKLQFGLSEMTWLESRYFLSSICALSPMPYTLLRGAYRVSRLNSIDTDFRPAFSRLTESDAGIRCTDESGLVW